jgi:hypothetical protein
MRTIFLLSSVLILSARIMYGQIADPSAIRHTLPGGIVVVPGDRIPVAAVSSPLAADPAVLSLYYHDSSLARLLWRVPANYGQFTTLNIGQRFDLPADTAVLDSIQVYVSELPVGRMRFDVWRNTLRKRVTADPQLYHYPDYWSGRSAAVSDSAFLFAGEQDTGRMVTVVFNGKPVSRHFHIVAEPYADTAFTSLFGIYTDTRPGTLDNISPAQARSHMMWNIGGSLVPVHMHGRFVDAEDSTKFFSPALYMNAFVTVGGVSGGDILALPAGIKLGRPYPSPGNSLLTLPFELKHSGHARIELFDAGGRSVRVAVDGDMEAGRHERRLDVSDFAPGVYHLRLSASGTALTRPFVISR